MTPAEQLRRVATACLGAALIASALSGCTLITSLTAEEAPPASSAPAPAPAPEVDGLQDTGVTEVPATSSAPTGTTLTDTRTSLEEWVGQQYGKKYGEPATVDCPGDETIQIYVGLVIDCTATEESGTAYPLVLTITRVEATEYFMDIERGAPA